MFSKNLRYYRLRAHLTKKDLAAKAQMTPMAITHYENGSRKPSMETMQVLASALGVRVSDFLAIRSDNLVFSHGEFRKNSTLNQSEQEYVRASVEEYFGRFMTAVEILGGEVLPTAPQCHVLHLSDNDDENATALREHLGFAVDGPLEDLIGKLENKGILIFESDLDNSKFSGMNGFVNSRPYIAYNPKMSAERNRSTIGHELAHLMFIWPEDLDDSAIEKKATAISGAFLFPRSDAIRELGQTRSTVTGDMVLIAKEYGISMFLLVTRAQICEILKPKAAQSFFIKASQAGWRTNEPSRIIKEQTSLFKQLVFRAVGEEEISISRAAELLKLPYNSVLEQCSISEGV